MSKSGLVTILWKVAYSSKKQFKKQILQYYKPKHFSNITELSNINYANPKANTKHFAPKTFAINLYIKHHFNKIHPHLHHIKGGKNKNNNIAVYPKGHIHTPIIHFIIFIDW